MTGMTKYVICRAPLSPGEWLVCVDLVSLHTSFLERLVLLFQGTYPG